MGYNVYNEQIPEKDWPPSGRVLGPTGFQETEASGLEGGAQGETE
jgi:hypothetical protein